MLLALGALFDGLAPDHPALARVGVALVEDDVVGAVAVAEDRAAVIRRPRHRIRAVHALAQEVGGAGREVGAVGRAHGLLARLAHDVRHSGLRVDVDQVGAVAAEHLLVERLREASLERDDERLVDLVAVVVDHHDDAAELGEHEVREAADELRVLERDPGRQQRLGHAAGRVHRVQAQPSGEVADEVDAVVGELRVHEEPRREQRLDAAGGGAGRDLLVECHGARSYVGR